MRLGVPSALALLTISVSSLASAQEESALQKAPAVEGESAPAKKAAAKPAASTETPQAPESHVTEGADPIRHEPEAKPVDEAAPEEEPGDSDEELEPDSDEGETEATESRRPPRDRKKSKKPRRARKAHADGDEEERSEGETEDEDSPGDEQQDHDIDEKDEAASTPPVSVIPLSARSQRTGFLIAPRLGLLFGGATHLDLECDETGNLGCGTFGVRDHDEASGLGIALDALYGIIPELRAGLSLHYLPQVKGDASGELRRLGPGLDFQAVAEGVFDITDRLAVTLRLQGGGTALVPSGFIDDVVKDAQDDCETARDAGIDCTVNDGPYFAPTLGGGAGVLIQTKGPARLRLDFLFQTHRMKLYEQKAASDGGTVDATLSMDQSRLWLLGGFEI